ncbi:MULTISPECIES: hypothetical protein [Nostocaceae]|uniref:hypothetical protein n=1 Tax=Nostocaceae TaxID=1162 RepID=UPI001681F3E0|nr:MULTISPECIES: hypothetical protein [Nostocaceae]MBD2479652.1 hypothetical protein [Anabaena sp. FACHB-83]
MLTYFLINWRGGTTPEDVVDAYVRALEKKDQNLMLRLVPGSYSSEQAVQDKVTQLGGHDIKEIQVSYTKIKPHIAIANIEGWYIDSKGERVNFKDTINLRYESGSFLVFYKGRWYLNLGRNKNPINLGPASTPF